MYTKQSHNLKELSIPIDPTNFVKKFKMKFENWGNIATKELQETWRLNCLTMNNAIRSQNTVIKYVIAAQEVVSCFCLCCRVFKQALPENISVENETKDKYS